MTAAVSLKETRLPRQVVEARARADRLATEQQTASEPPLTIAPETPPQPGQAPETNPPPAPPAEEPQTTTEPKQELRPFHDPALLTDPRADDPAYWRQRLSVLQGRMRDERREFEGREAALRTKVADLEAQIRTLKAAGQPTPVDLPSMFTPEQLEALGQEQAAAIASASVKAAQRQVEAKLAEQREAAEAQRQHELEQAQARRGRDFLDQLDELVPDWRTINARQDWLDWLAEIDPTTGQTRQTPLTALERAGDAQGVAAVFGAFRQKLAQRPAPPVTAPRSAGTPQATPSAAVDRSQLAPTPEEIKDYYKRLSVNRGKGVSEAERVEFEKRLKLVHAP